MVAWRTALHHPDLVDRLAEERLVVGGAVGGEPVALVEVHGALVGRGHPEVDGGLADGRVEELLPDAVAVVRVEQVDEVQLALTRGQPTTFPGTNEMSGNSSDR